MEGVFSYPPRNWSQFLLRKRLTHLPAQEAPSNVTLVYTGLWSGVYPTSNLDQISKGLP